MATTCPIKSLCAGELRHRITIEKRTSNGSFNPDQINGTTSFDVLTTQRVKIQTISPSSRFNGVAITDIPTHKFTMRYRKSIMDLDTSGEYFIRTKDRFFRIVKNGITNVDEQNKVIIILCNERGFTSKEATNA